ASGEVPQVRRGGARGELAVTGGEALLLGQHEVSGTEAEADDRAGQRHRAPRATSEEELLHLVQGPARRDRRPVGDRLPGDRYRGHHRASIAEEARADGEGASRGQHLEVLDGDEGARDAPLV